MSVYNFSELLSKYDVPTPRYTSYPTVPYWDGALTPIEWITELKKSCADKAAKLALYLHLPFCERLCFFCGCNTVITKNHALENPYLESLFKEVDVYKNKVPELGSIGLSEMHIGGGTPTYFSAVNIEKLLSKIFSSFNRSSEFQGSIEIDPRHFNEEQMQVLSKFGFQRISLGVQDFNPEVQRAVNRIQPFDMTRSATELARRYGVQSVNFDLIYGLPLQTRETIATTIDQVIELRPDRIAFYSFAHVPWIKEAHIKLAKTALIGAEKRELYEIGRAQLLSAGYVEIGMDHFALPSDGLAKSLELRALHRNFMGYVENKTDILLGLGVSAISSCQGAYSQNLKTLAEYQSSLNEAVLPVMRGHIMTKEDQLCYRLIQEVMTQGMTSLPSEFPEVRQRLAELEQDQLLHFSGDKLEVTQLGRAFLRNIAVAFDNRLHRDKPNSIMFSRAV